MYTGKVIEDLIATVRRAEESARRDEELVRVPQFQSLPTHLSDLRYGETTTAWVA